ncbi:Dam family site-specific DNA-(adenine-N6)-methyltransferase [Clostridium boliviensis]|uniref:Site-specific DNA-methyltransferase (adenine-specific) n=1 Tax=Clostridium boliviensis TaxID=318465 RepID=A0ABU4GQ94_9CLOT|nr:Dam family site-specific DNA-(adenine-N6)-methyltransferase [Clostridium boliviensis]MDW2799794.1 Dam family site-specific DNA-(adenine-N6)-methyltransferase [Clostridium boliviensis]
MYIKSPLNYTGGKFKILEPVFQAFPADIRTFVDVFAGGFNIGINAEAETIICNDQINYLIEMFQMFQATDIRELLERIRDIISTYQLTQQNKDGYYALRSDYNQTHDLTKLFVLTCYAFNHQIRFNNSHEFNSPFGRNRSSFNSNIERNLTRFCQALQKKNIQFTNKDFTELDYSKLGPEDLVYCDPPYLISTGNYNDGNRGFKDWKDKEERELLDLLDRLNHNGIRFALSNVFYHKGLSNELLIEWSRKYRIHYIDKTYSNCNYQFKERDAVTVEVLITNY